MRFYDNIHVFKFERSKTAKSVAGNSNENNNNVPFYDVNGLSKTTRFPGQRLNKIYIIDNGTRYQVRLNLFRKERKRENLKMTHKILPDFRSLFMYI